MENDFDYRALLDRRLHPHRDGWLTVRTTLKHFALINYALPASRLAPHIPTDRFALAEFDIGGERRAMLGVVPFLDVDFHFVRLFPFLRFHFGQTNHRVYVIDKATGEPCVWFFGTTLGSPVVHIARTLWRIPWHYARYRVDCAYDAAAHRYDRFRYTVESDWCSARVDIEDTGEPLALTGGFGTIEEMRLVLTHPVDGYFYRTDNKLGTYSVWHDLMHGSIGRGTDLYFSLYDRLDILSADEMQRPHSIFLSPEIAFSILLPPKRLT
jgi:uncharacterized protein YqjF (DUF2071 family)